MRKGVFEIKEKPTIYKMSGEGRMPDILLVGVKHE